MIRELLIFADRKSDTVTTGDLLSTENMKSFTKKMIKGMKGVENIYTQHSPLVKEMAEELARGRLRTTQFPYMGTVQLQDRPRDIIIFVVGGATYEESLAIHNLNSALQGVRIVLGSSNIHNFRSFVDDVRSATHSTPVTSKTF